MITTNTLERYLEASLKGDRHQCRAILEEVLQTGTPANHVYMDIIWPIMVEIDDLARTDRITPAAEHLATRINRTLIDQLQNKLPRRQSKGKKIAICCAAEEIQELGAQITADLFESDGWDVKFLGGGLTNEDILTFVNENGLDILLIYGTSPTQAPGIRNMIDRIKDVNAWPNMKIMVSGGLFNRAEGLWEEIGADIFAASAQEAVQIASSDSPVESAIGRTINTRKHRTKKTATAMADVAAVTVETNQN